MSDMDYKHLDKIGDCVIPENKNCSDGLNLLVPTEDKCVFEILFGVVRTASKYTLFLKSENQ